MGRKPHLNKIDRELISEALFAIASEGVLQGYNNAAKSTQIDNDAIRERVLETLALIEAELVAIELLGGKNA
ncbi:hypothetical protein Q4578_03975 [Shimia thalassica]|uniref:hypothetical protein n=1 Tax=Shimia thalassica TaxID=1715693 RepID=UPI0026E39C80|nr:hypothetical protein [Shimia thalassica]MDO6520727.1 hypothetical protein [Shimia thalassica]MDP2495480.1 hypothetical protein [Shimia thalassica]